MSCIATASIVAGAAAAGSVLAVAAVAVAFLLSPGRHAPDKVAGISCCGRRPPGGEGRPEPSARLVARVANLLKRKNAPFLVKNAPNDVFTTKGPEKMPDTQKWVLSLTKENAPWLKKCHFLNEALKIPGWQHCLVHPPFRSLKKEGGNGLCNETHLSSIYCEDTHCFSSGTGRNREPAPPTSPGAKSDSQGHSRNARKKHLK